MQKTFTNPCNRCGKERIVVKSWEEQVYSYPGATKVTHVEKVCPDPACQAEVDKANKTQKDKNAAIRRKSEQRLLARKAKLDALRLSKREMV